MNLLLTLLVLSPITAVVLGFVSPYLIIAKKNKLKFNYWTTSLLILFFWSFFVGIINKSLMSTLGSLLILVYFFSSQLAFKISSNKKKINLILDKLVFLAGITAVLGIVEKIIFILIGDSGHRIYSTYGNPNMTGGWFAIIIFIAEYLYSCSNNKKEKMKYLALSGLVIIALLLTGSRSSYIALAITFLCISYFKYIGRGKKIGFLILFISSAIIVIALFSKSTIFSEYILAHPFEDSLRPRLATWTDGISVIKNNFLFGLGLLFPYEYGGEILQTYGKPTLHMHNLWLTILSTTGIVGLLIYLYMKCKMFLSIFNIYKKNKNLGLLFFAINLIILVQGLVDVSLFAPQIGILFSIIGASASKLEQEDNIIIVKEVIIKKELKVQKEDISA